MTAGIAAPPSPVGVGYYGLWTLSLTDATQVVLMRQQQVFQPPPQETWLLSSSSLGEGEVEDCPVTCNNGAMMHVQLRPAVSEDVQELRALDHVAQVDVRRVELIEKSVSDGACILAQTADRIAGYAVLNYSFFHFGFIELLYVRESMRRLGIAAALLSKLEAICKTDKLFTSTNESNSAMRSLLQAAGFLPSGRIDNLDDGDPELVFFKRLSDP